MAAVHIHFMISNFLNEISTVETIMELMSFSDALMTGCIIVTEIINRKQTALH